MIKLIVNIIRRGGCVTESLKTPFPVLLLPLCDQARLGTNICLAWLTFQLSPKVANS